MKKYNIIIALSLLLISSLTTSCSDKEPWGISEPIIAINPTFEKLTNTDLAKVTNHDFKTYKTKYNNKIVISKLRKAKLNLHSEMHFQPQDFGLILRVNSSCLYAKTTNNQETFKTKDILEDSIDIKIQKNIPFLSLVPVSLLDFHNKAMLGKKIICDFDFKAENNKGDIHTFKLKKATFASQTHTKQSISNLTSNIKIFLKSELTNENSQYKSQLNQENKIFNEHDLAYLYFEDVYKTKIVELYCKNKELNHSINISDNNLKKLRLSYFDIQNKNHHDVKKTSLCRIIQYDEFSNIKKLSPLFTIDLESITSTPGPVKKQPPAPRVCPGMQVDVGDGQCSHI